MGKCSGFGRLTARGRCKRESNRGSLYRSVNADDDIQLLHKIGSAKWGWTALVGKRYCYDHLFRH